ncbi:Tol-Pal system beta propeller repeat protein TolB [Parendozoicomonas haliclonae]|uniref:Tol-Pal system protein TolB n=1 Tax=Parendozoicomonas haliclonae TaxID=1960125 RepID=A0A1X7AF38_9GAMM|nr:Tol-Pal system beta propeller repeat protein TolB [Parendozoicomonas haliclonae]SMA36484.1 translocation protein TolB [Parendozoicomonas haliclonae]
MTRIKFSAVWSMLLRISLVPLLLLSLQARAELTIEITRGNDQAVPVAVVPFAWNGAGVLPEDISGIVGNDLRLSGQFAPVSSEQFLGFPSKKEEVFFGDWRRLGANFLLIGRVNEQAGGQYVTEFELYDVISQKLVHSGKVPGTRNQLRAIAHKISDEVYKEITGVDGVFSTKIVYVVAKRFSVDRTDYKLVYADMDGRNQIAILNSKEPVLAPSWSPDGRKLAYVSFETGRPAIYIHELATGRRERISSFKGLNSAPKWSPDGKKLAMVLSKSGNPDIYVLDLETRQLSQVTRHFALDNEPDWMPDGKSLVFTSNRGGSAQLYEVELASGETKRLSFDGKFNARARVFPDGKKIAYIHKGEGATSYNVAVQELDSGRMRTLSSSPFEDAPDVSPNGRMLIYSAQGGDQGVLGIISADGRVSFRLPSSEGDVREPAWSPYIR